MPMHHLNPLGFGIDFFYTAIIIILCLIIYYKTKEMYELSKYKGIKYFRSAFVFFGLAYATKFIFQFLGLSNKTFDLFLHMRIIIPFSLMLMGYFSTMAIFYLVYSPIWKKIKENHFLIFSNLIAITISLISFINKSPEFIGVVQIILILLGIILIFTKKNKKFSQINTLYILLLLFWLFSLFILGPNRMLPFELKILFNIISLFIFLVIFYKVQKWVK